jgi:MobA-like NTP transferase domain
VVLAAGLGSRYGAAKQLEAFGPHGETLTDYSIYDARKAGVDRVVFVIRPDLEEAVRRSIGRRWASRLDVHYAMQIVGDIPASFGPTHRTKPWGTGHAVLAAGPYITGPFIAVNADDYYGPASYELACRHLEASDPTTPNFALVGFRLRDTLSPAGGVSRAVCALDPDNLLRRVEEVRELAYDAGTIYGQGSAGGRTVTGDETVSMNMWCFNPTVLSLLKDLFVAFLSEHGDDDQSEFLLPDAVNRMIATDRAEVRVLPSPERWFGVTYPADAAAARHHIEERIDRGLYPT